MDSFNKIYAAIKSNPFIVIAPVAIRDSKEDLEQGISCGTDEHGNGIKYDPAKMDVFGISVYKMAIAYSEGLSFSLYEKSDLPRLVTLIEKFLKITDASMRNINFRKAANEDIDLVYDFGKNIIELNRSIKRGDNVEIKKVLSVTGFISPSTNATQTKTSAPITAKARQRIIRVRPRKEE